METRLQELRKEWIRTKCWIGMKQRSKSIWRKVKQVCLLAAWIRGQASVSPGSMALSLLFNAVGYLTVYIRKGDELYSNVLIHLIY